MIYSAWLATKGVPAGGARPTAHLAGAAHLSFVCDTKPWLRVAGGGFLARSLGEAAGSSTCT